MKKKFPFLSKLIIILIYITIHIECRRKLQNPNNKISPYPHPEEAPTSLEQLNQSKPGPQLLSKTLNELDPSRGITREQFMNRIKYASYQIDRSQMELIFTFVDQNHNDIIERQEWELFLTLYVLPYEACLQWKGQDNQTNATDSQNTNETNATDSQNMNQINATDSQNMKTNSTSEYYKLNLEQFKTCFEADPKTRMITFREMDKKRNPFQIIKNIISLEASPGINFYQYLFTRKAIFGWFQCCSSKNHIGKNDFNCAIGHLLPTKVLTDLEKENIYNLGIKYQFNEYSLIQLDFIAFLRIGHYTNIFSLFERKNTFSALFKSDFLNAIKEDREANNIREEDINNLYLISNDDPHKIKNEINFETWCFFFHFHKLFERYSKEKPFQLSQAEFLNLLNDDETPIKIVMSLDSSFTNFEEMHYQEASLSLQLLRPNESKFFYSFRTKHKTHSKHKKDPPGQKAPEEAIKQITGSYYDYLSLRNQTNRERFFAICTDSVYMTRADYLKAIQFANFFTDFCEISQTGSNKDLRAYYSILKVQNLLSKLDSSFEMTNPVISHAQRKARDYLKFMPENISLDMLAFITLMNFEHKIQITTGSIQNELISELNLKNILQSFGMKNMPDTVLDVSKKKNDQLNKRMFVINDMIKNVIIVQAVACELMRNTYDIIKNNLKLSTELSRLFPTEKRRFQSSPFI